MQKLFSKLFVGTSTGNRKTFSYSRTAAVGKMGKKKMFCFFQSFFFFHVVNCHHAHQQLHSTIDLRSRHRINQRSARFVSDKASEGGSRRYRVDPSSRGRKVARGVLHSSPNPAKSFLFCFCRAFHAAFFSYGVVRYGAVLPNRTAPYDFASNKTAPHRTASHLRIKKKKKTLPHRTAPHRDSKRQSAPNRTVRISQK